MNTVDDKVLLWNTDKRYSIIYADPPWSYKDKRNGFGGAEDHYSTMSIEDIKKLPVNQISEKDCLLFLWVTFPNLQEGLDVIKAWGFKYKTLGFSWLKTNRKNGELFFGIGHYTRSNCEVCLIGVRGKKWNLSKKISSAIIHPLQEHSKKPDAIRNRIVDLCGNLPRIELFARHKAEGWDVWGNEV